MKNYKIYLLIGSLVVIVIAGLMYFENSKNKQINGTDTQVLREPDYFINLPKDPSMEAVFNEGLVKYGKLAQSCSAKNAEVLMYLVKKSGDTIAEFESNISISRVYGILGLSQLITVCRPYNDTEYFSDLIPYLSNVLSSPKSSEMEIMVAGSTLAQFGNPDATKAIIDFAKTYQGDASKLIFYWLRTVRDGSSVILLSDVIKSPELFANEKNKNALIEANKYWCAGRSGLLTETCKDLGFPTL